MSRPSLLARMSTAAAICLLASPCFAAAPVSTQLLSNASLYQGTVSAGILPSTTDDVYTAYFSMTSAATALYSVYVETSPDGGVTWSSVTSFQIQKGQTAGYAYQYTFSAKTTKLRFAVGGTVAGSGMVGLGSAWFVN